MALPLVMLRILVFAAVFAIARVPQTQAVENQVAAIRAIPSIPGISVTHDDTVALPVETRPSVFNSANAFGFRDGRINASTGNNRGALSTDGGKTWRPYPHGARPQGGEGPVAKKAVYEWPDGEVLAIGSKTESCAKPGLEPRSPDYIACEQQDFAPTVYFVRSIRSVSNWTDHGNIQAGTSIFILPSNISVQPYFTDVGRSLPYGGLILQKGLIELMNGGLMATLHGNYAEDNEPVPCYEPAWQLKKKRSVVMFSADRGRTWRNPVTVAAPSIRPSFEGFTESDLLRSRNGDILMFMRSGDSRDPRCPSTPLYVSRSTDEGLTWSVPTVVNATHGTNPTAVLLDNDIIVVTYGGSGGEEIKFSDDDGHTWKGPVKVSPHFRYTDIVKIGSDRIAVFASEPKGVNVSFFTVRRRTP
jgi:BNR/Asp-box repeat